MKAYETIEVERDGSVAIVRLNRRSVLNAIIAMVQRR
jgi:enoyl-CoA hydratase/carnithine racemase